jgi:hypothetical protein
MTMIIEQIALAEANALLTSAPKHYLGRVRNAEYCLSTPERDALAVYRPPVAPAFTKALGRPLEISRLWRSPSFSGAVSSYNSSGKPWPAKQLSEFVAATRRWIKKSAPEVPVIFSYSDETVANSAIPRRSHDGSIYRVSGFTFLGYSTRMPRWVDGDGVPISAKMASARHGTRDIEKIATLEPSWRLIPGEPKQLWCYGLTMTADEVGAALDAAAVSGTALYTRGLPPPLRIWET